MSSRRSRSILAVAASAATALTCASVTHAQLIYDPFNYTPGAALDAKVNPVNGFPWSVMSTDPVNDDDILINGSNLSYPGLASPLGNSVTYGGTGKSERLSIGGAIFSGTAYYSLVLQVNDASNLNATPVFIAGFSNRTGTSDLQPTTVGTRLYLRQSQSNPGSFNLGVSKNSSNINDIAFDSGDYSPGTPILIVGSYQINPAAGNDDLASLYINPGSLGSDVPPSPNITAPQTGTDLIDGGQPSVAAFVLRQAVAGVPGVQVDEVRVDSTWAQVTPPAGVAWNVDSDGTWGVGGNWNTFASPNDPAAFVNFPAVNSAIRTVTLDMPIALRTINFTSPIGYTIVGGAGQPLQFSASAAINVLAGDHTIAAPVSLGENLELSIALGASLTMTNELIAPSAVLIKAGAGTAQLPRVQVDQLNIEGGTLQIAPDGGSAGIFRTRVIAIPIGGSGRFDISNNGLVVSAGGTDIGSLSGSSYTGVTGLIARARNGGSWSGSGITTSQPDAIVASHGTSLGIATASQAKDIGQFETALWNGQTVTGGDTLVMYTYTGDANLDGKINVDDYIQIDNGIAGGLSGWSNGDFNYDGKINIDDYTLIDSAIATQGPPLGSAAALGDSAVSAVPEPSALLPSASLIGLVASRRRRRTV